MRLCDVIQIKKGNIQRCIMSIRDQDIYKLARIDDKF